MKLIILLALYLFSLACEKLPGTNTGNPDIYATPVNGIILPINKLKNSVCARITTCNNLQTLESCLADIDIAAGFTDELALNPPYMTFQAASAAYNSGALKFNDSNFSSCTGAIENLACSDILVTSAYSSSTPADYSKLYLLYRASASCQSIKQ